MPETESVSHRKALGRGLAALIPSEAAATPGGSVSGTIREVEVSLIRPNRMQPRQRFDAKGLEGLIGSVKEVGLLQPLVVQRLEGEPGYELLAGERRLRAVRAAGLTKVPCVIREVAGDRQRLQVSLVENIQRRDLNAIELGQAFRRLQEECGLSQEEIATVVGHDRSSVANLIRLLKLPEDLQAAVTSGALSMGHARALLGCSSVGAQRRLARQIVDEGLSVRQVEVLARQEGEDTGEGPAASAGRKERRPKDPNLRAVEETLQRSLGTKVTLQPRARGKGRIVIEYHSAEECDRLVTALTAGAEG